MARWVIRRGRQGELWAGTWQAWQRLPTGDRMVCVWKTYEGCWEFLDERCNICKRPRWSGCSDNFHREWLDAVYA